MIIEFNRLDRQFEMYRSEYEDAVLRVLRSGRYILGDEVRSFEKKFAEFIGSTYCVGVNSGLDALTLAFRALSIGKGDEVIVPANTFIASILGFTELGAVPIFVEPDEFYNIDVAQIEGAVTIKTKAILPVHLYGQAANIEKIKNIAEENSLYLVEDCAQSHGAKFDGKTTGLFGDAACFSFYPTKNLGAIGDAGAVVTDNKEVYDNLRKLRNYGGTKKNQHEIKGINSRLDEVQAAFLNVKMDHSTELLEQRLKIAGDYQKGIDNPLIILPTVREGAGHVWHLFIVRVDDRDYFRDYLGEKGIETQFHYPIPPHLSATYKRLGYNKGSFPITERYAETSVSLPLFNGMTEEEVNYIINCVNDYKR